jgi:hypothetical protein
MNEETERAKSIDRSPSYPAIDLETAIAWASILYSREKRNPAYVADVLEHWKSFENQPSAPSFSTISALIKFGLVEPDGSRAERKVVITELALRILLDPSRTTLDCTQAIQTAALRPKIHREIFEKFGNSLPSDPTMRRWLILEKEFSERGATELAKEYRRTMSFARQTDDNQDSESECRQGTQALPSEILSASLSIGRPSNAGVSSDSPKASASSESLRELQIPLLGKTALLRVPYPLTEMDWTIMQSVLLAMKPGLVLASAEEFEKDSSSQCDNLEEKGGEKRMTGEYNGNYP